MRNAKDRSRRKKCLSAQTAFDPVLYGHDSAVTHPAKSPNGMIGTPEPSRSFAVLLAEEQ
jgi:hypothetical protein